jgi:hypothetical protein
VPRREDEIAVAVERDVRRMVEHGEHRIALGAVAEESAARHRLDVAVRVDGADAVVVPVLEERATVGSERQVLRQVEARLRRGHVLLAKGGDAVPRVGADGSRSRGAGIANVVVAVAGHEEHERKNRLHGAAPYS